MILYLDTSALVKLYAAEAGSDLVREGIANADVIATSLLSYVETRSAFARKWRAGEIDSAALKRYTREFEADWARIQRLPIDTATIRRAGELVDRYVLRASDALHLATADILRASLRDPVTFACFDGELSRAAAAHGFAVASSR